MNLSNVKDAPTGGECAHRFNENPSAHEILLHSIYQTESLAVSGIVYKLVMKVAKLLVLCFSLSELLLLVILAVESLIFLSHLVLALSHPVIQIFVLFWDLPIEQKSTLFLVFSMFSELYYAVVEKRQITLLGYGGLLVIGLSLVLVYFVAVFFAFGLAMRYSLEVLRWTESFSNFTIRKLMELIFITTGSILCLAVESTIVGDEKGMNKKEREINGAGVEIEEERWGTLLKLSLK
jgi:hypothetical protein